MPHRTKPLLETILSFHQGVLWHSPDINFTVNFQDVNSWNEVETSRSLVKECLPACNLPAFTKSCLIIIMTPYMYNTWRIKSLATRKYKSSALLSFVREIQRRLVDFPIKGPAILKYLSCHAYASMCHIYRSIVSSPVWQYNAKQWSPGTLSPIICGILCQRRQTCRSWINNYIPLCSVECNDVFCSSYMLECAILF